VAGIVEFQSDVAANNALVAGASYVTTPAVAGLLMQRQRFSSTDTPLWEGGMLDGRVMGFRAMSSNQMASATMLFGDFSQVIIGEWGVLELMTNPYSDFTRGLTGLRAWYTCDVAVRQTGAFSYASSIT
jgi:HK97 family phage major capsid protein